MGIFSQSECQRCFEHEKEVELLRLRNKRLESALVELKHKYDKLSTQELDNETDTKLSSSDIDTLFQQIKQSSHDKDKKRYLRSMVMLIKANYESSLHEYIQSQLN